MARETRFHSQVESYKRLKKWYLIPLCLTISIIMYISRVKWSNPGNVVALSTTPWCSSYWKGSLLVALDYGRKLYFTYIYKERERQRDRDRDRERNFGFVVFESQTIKVFGWCCFSDREAFAGKDLVLGEISFLILLSFVWTSILFSHLKLKKKRFYFYKGFPWEQTFPICLTNHRSFCTR